MERLDPRIIEYFGDDEYPELSWTYLHPIDQRWIRRVTAADIPDPGVMSMDTFRGLGPDDQFRRVRALEDWYKVWPYVRTRQVRDIERHLASLPEATPAYDDGMIDVPVITGLPGVGKTFLMKRAAVKAMCTAARDRRLSSESRGAQDFLVEPHWRPVIYHSVDGNPRKNVFFAHLCAELEVPAGAVPGSTFKQAVIRHGVRRIFIDEVQMINFDGQYGMELHNALKSVQNEHTRVILAGHSMREMLVPRKTAAQNAAQNQSLARWAFLELGRYLHRTEEEVAEWRKFLQRYDSHIRLTGHEPGAPVFSVEFEELCWVLTLGYVNAVASLVTSACLTAIRSGTQRITTQILLSIRLNERVARGREERLRRLHDKSFNWSSDAVGTL